MSSSEGLTGLTDKSVTVSWGFWGDKKKVQKSDLGGARGFDQRRLAAGCDRWTRYADAASAASLSS